jgi:hypothetical protein
MKMRTMKKLPNNEWHPSRPWQTEEAIAASSFWDAQEWDAGSAPQNAPAPVFDTTVLHAPAAVHWTLRE